MRPAHIHLNLMLTATIVASLDHRSHCNILISVFTLRKGFICFPARFRLLAIVGIIFFHSFRVRTEDDFFYVHKQEVTNLFQFNLGTVCYECQKNTLVSVC